MPRARIFEGSTNPQSGCSRFSNAEVLSFPRHTEQALDLQSLEVDILPWRTQLQIRSRLRGLSNIRVFHVFVHQGIDWVTLYSFVCPNHIARLEDRMKNLTRREFIVGGACAGAIGAHLLLNSAGVAAGNGVVDLGVAKGGDPLRLAAAAVDALGGMGRFVPRGSTVAVLVNSAFKHPGSITHPDVALSVIGQCFAAGAKRVISVKEETDAYWQRGKSAAKFREQVSALSRAGGLVKKSFPKDRTLREIEVVRGFLDSDVVINVPVAKHHKGPGYSGAMKNLMGALPHSSNKFFHFGSGSSDWYDDVPHLCRCIVDLNLMRKPDLVVVDATTVLLSDGPYGPGKLGTVGQVAAGTDSVLIDAYCSPLVGRPAEKVPYIGQAASSGLGSMNVSKARIEIKKVP